MQLLGYYYQFVLVRDLHCFGQFLLSLVFLIKLNALVPTRKLQLLGYIHVHVLQGRIDRGKGGTWGQLPPFQGRLSYSILNYSAMFG